MEPINGRIRRRRRSKCIESSIIYQKQYSAGKHNFAGTNNTEDYVKFDATHYMSFVFFC